METCAARTKSARHYRRYVSDEKAKAEGTDPVA